MKKKLSIHRSTQHRKGSLAAYDAALRALEVCTQVDVAKDIFNGWAGAEAYARQARDSTLAERAATVRFNAQTRCGELLLSMRDSGERDAGKGGDRRSRSRPVTVNLADLKISKAQSSRWQDLARRKQGFPDLWQRELAEAIAVARMATEGRRAVLGALNAGWHEREKTNRAEREQLLSVRIRSLPTKKYGVVYADPPWQFQTWSDRGKTYTSAENHYPTSPLGKIMGLDVPSIAYDSAVLFLWATVPMLPEAFDVMGAWGFQYRSHVIWMKSRAGTGYWLRSRHELLLIGVRGDELPAPAPGEQYESVIEAAVGSHSSKPECFHVMIEKMFPHLPRIELYARGPARPGWDVWGAEAIQNDGSSDHEIGAAPISNEGHAQP